MKAFRTMNVRNDWEWDESWKRLVGNRKLGLTSQPLRLIFESHGLPLRDEESRLDRARSHSEP